MIEKYQESEIANIITRALIEDAAWQDVTSESIIPEELQSNAVITVKETGVLAGIDICCQVFQEVDAGLDVKKILPEGSSIKKGDVVATINGKTRGTLAAERTALNFLGRLSGIASLTANFVKEVEGLPCYISDTRKTTPTLRLIEKQAVKTGGGHNHRMNLGDGVLIKDNHLAALKATGLTLASVVNKARQEIGPGTKLEVEVTTFEEAIEAARAGADILMLDNMGVEEMRRTVEAIAGRAKVEASGCITLSNARLVASTGVDYISVGALTHSARSLDFSLEITRPRPC